MKTLEFFFQETQIHFLLQNEGNVMVNATEMAKAFGKRVDHFLKSHHAKAFIEALKLDPNGVNLTIKLPPNGVSLIDKNENKLPPNGGSLKDENVISFRGRNGIYFHRALALKFAAWLDPHFEVWVFNTMDNLLFGNYKKHWEAHAAKEIAEAKMEMLKHELLADPTPEMAMAYFEAERDAKTAKNAKTAAIREQLKLF